MRSDRSVSGFREHQRNAAAKVAPGDKLVCYLTRVGRWFGLLEVTAGPYTDDSPIFVPANDPFIVRFMVKPIVTLEIQKSIPIRNDTIWDELSFTKEQDKASSKWTGAARQPDCTR
jgi:predicted RNA-binding protein